MIKSLSVLLLLGAIGFGLGFAGKPNPSTAKVQVAASTSGRELARLLQRGDPGAAMDEMKRLAKEDPLSFFKELEHFPWLEGMDDLIQLAVRGLRSEDPANAVKILNGISHRDYREKAWFSYLLGLKDRSLSERLEIAAEFQSQPLVVSILISSAVRADMEGTLRELEKKPFRKYYANALLQLGGSDPAQAAKRAKKAIAEGVLDADMFWGVMESLVSTEDPAERAEVIAEIGNRDLKELPFGSSERIFYEKNFRENHIGVAEILALPEMRRNMILSNIALVYCDDPAEMAAVLNGMSSATLQVNAVDGLLAMTTPEGTVTAMMEFIESPKVRAMIEEMLRTREESLVPKE